MITPKQMKIISAISSALNRHHNQTQPTKMTASATLTSPQFNHPTKSLNLMITSQLKDLVTLKNINSKMHRKRMMMGLGILTMNNHKSKLPIWVQPQISR